MTDLLVVNSPTQDFSKLDEYAGSDLVLLLVMDNNSLSGSFDESIEGLQSKAEELRKELELRKINCKVVTEWGDRNQAITNTLLREKAKLLSYT